MGAKHPRSLVYLLTIFSVDLDPNKINRTAFYRPDVACSWITGDMS